MRLRTLLERASRGVVVKRRLPVRFGRLPVFVSPDAGLRFWRRDLSRADSQLFDWAAEFVRPGDVVWDIGANVGLFSFASAFQAGGAGRVYAVEADPWLAGLLRRSARLAADRRAVVEVIPVAVSDRVGLARFAIAQRGRCGNFLEVAGGSSEAGGSRETSWVATASLDSLRADLRPPRIVKIDIEGAEYLALSGGERLLSEVRPIIICEVLRDQTSVRDLLTRHRYQLFNAAVHPSRRQPVQELPFNVLAVPS